MSDEALIAELERQREPARQYFAYYDALLAGRDVAPERPNPDLREMTVPLTAVITAHPVFGPGRNIFFAQKQLNLHPLYTPHGLLRATLASDAQTAVACLHRLFKTECADLRMVAAVHGLEVQQPVFLSNGVRLLPFAAAPDSPQMRWFARGYQGNRWSLDIASATLPTIAVFDMGTIPATTDIEAGQGANETAFAMLLDATRAFTLTDRGAPVVGNFWTDSVDPELTLFEFGMVWTMARFEGSQPHTPLEVDDQAVEWAERYLRMEGPLRRSVDVALDRLNLARRRRSAGDQAIDGGICLEALLVEDSNQELTYKLQLRAALLLGRTLPDREAIRKAVRDFYSLRSKVVHGRARRSEDRSPDWECASRGLEICTKAVRAIVQLNVRPDFTTWELTGGPPVEEVS